MTDTEPKTEPKAEEPKARRGRRPQGKPRNLIARVGFRHPGGYVARGELVSSDDPVVEGRENLFTDPATAERFT